MSECTIRRWRKDQAKLFNGELKMSAKRTTMDRFTPKYPELDPQILEWFTEKSDQGEQMFCHSTKVGVTGSLKSEPARELNFHCVGTDAPIVQI